MVIATHTRLDQTKSYLLQYIQNRKLAQGDQLPSEAEMAKALGVSRNTIREAYISLEGEGIIVRRHGIGTFVTRVPIIADSQNNFSSFPQRIKAAGYVPSFRNLVVTYATAPREAYATFDMKEHQPLLRIQRVVMANEIPAVHISDYFAPTIRKEDFDRAAFTGDMLDFVASSLGVVEAQLHSKFKASTTDAELAAHLELAVAQPVVCVQATVSALAGEPLIYTEGYLNPTIIVLEFTHIIRGK